MFSPVKARTIDEYIQNLEPDRRKQIQELDAFIRKAAPSLIPHFAYNMLGYGSFKYVNYKKDVIDWPVVSLASQKNYISIYVCALYRGTYIAEKFKQKLGNVSVGKSCIRLKKLEDIRLDTLKEVLDLAVKNPGLHH